MGAKFVALSTPTATVNTNGISCKVDDDCLNGKGTYGVSKTAMPAITSSSANFKTTCCLYYAVVTAPSGTAAEIAVATATFTTYNNYYGVGSTVGEYNKYCTYEYPKNV